MVSYKCAEDKLESTLGLALAAFRAHPPALIMANKGAAHLHWDWKLLPWKVAFPTADSDLDRLRLCLLEQQPQDSLLLMEKSQPIYLCTK